MKNLKWKKNSGSSGMKLSVCNMKVSNMEESVREGLLCKTLHDANVRWITLFLVGLNSLYSNMYTIMYMIVWLPNNNLCGGIHFFIPFVLYLQCTWYCMYNHYILEHFKGISNWFGLAKVCKYCTYCGIKQAWYTAKLFQKGMIGYLPYLNSAKWPHTRSVTWYHMISEEYMVL